MRSISSESLIRLLAGAPAPIDLCELVRSGVPCETCGVSTGQGERGSGEAGVYLMRPAACILASCLLATLARGTSPATRASRTGKLPGSASAPAQGSAAGIEQQVAWALFQARAAEEPPADRDIQRPVKALCCRERGEGSSRGDATEPAIDRSPAALPSLDASLCSEGAAPLLRATSQCQGIPYRWRDASKGGMECSGLMVPAGAELGQRPSHSAAQLYDLVEPVAEGAGRPGDRAFLASTYTPGIQQVGISRDETSVAHASGSAGRVTTSDPAGPCLEGKYAGAERLRLSIDPAEAGYESRLVSEECFISRRCVDDLWARGEEGSPPRRLGLAWPREPCWEKCHSH